MGVESYSLISALFVVCAAVSCLDENGSPVDWWFAYKVSCSFESRSQSASCRTAHATPTAMPTLLLEAARWSPLSTELLTAATMAVLWAPHCTRFCACTIRRIARRIFLKTLAIQNSLLKIPANTSVPFSRDCSSQFSRHPSAPIHLILPVT